MVISAKNIADVIREAYMRSAQLYLSPQTLEEICRHLEGKQKRMTLDEVQEWCQTRENKRDPIFIVPNDGPSFWIMDPDEVDGFHESVLTGRYAVWTGRPTASQEKQQRERRHA